MPCAKTVNFIYHPKGPRTNTTPKNLEPSQTNNLR
jgi:hypothetical protein